MFAVSPSCLASRLQPCFRHCVRPDQLHQIAHSPAFPPDAPRWSKGMVIFSKQFQLLGVCRKPFVIPAGIDPLDHFVAELYHRTDADRPRPRQLAPVRQHNIRLPLKNGGGGNCLPGFSLIHAYGRKIKRRTKAPPINNKVP